MYFPDLGSTSQIAWGEAIRAVGWLDGSHEYRRGDVPPAFVVKLTEFAARCSESTRALKWSVAGGWHTCELCHAFHRGGNFGVPGNGVLYACPEMLPHYVSGHEYLPPDEFIEAVLASPLPGTAEYDHAVEPFQCELAPRPRVPDR